jgi:RNA polymerase sigma-70 factor (ECF subfamily)
LAELALAVARRVLNGRRLRSEEKENLAQDAVASVLAYLRSGGEVTANLAAFLGWRARGVLSDHVKSLRSEPQARELDEVWSTADLSPSPEERTESVELRALVRGCIQRLSLPLSRVVDLHYVKGLTVRDVATRVGLPRSTAMNRIREALLALRECLRRHGVEVA